MCACGVLFAVLVSAALIILWPPETWGDAPKHLGPCAFFGLWFTFTWRRARTGLYANRSALRIRGIIRTRTVAWTDIAAIDTDPARWLGMDMDRKAVWITLTNNTTIETPVQRSNGMPPGGINKDIGPVLRPDAFDELLAELLLYLDSPNARPTP
jgi:hypothetical protein